MIAFVRWISRAYRSWLNKLAQRSFESVWRGCFVLVAIVVGGVVASGAVSNSFGGLAERTYREAIYQAADGSIDVTLIDPLPGSVANPALLRARTEVEPQGRGDDGVRPVDQPRVSAVSEQAHSKFFRAGAARVRHSRRDRGGRHCRRRRGFELVRQTGRTHLPGLDRSACRQRHRPHRKFL